MVGVRQLLQRQPPAERPVRLAITNPTAIMTVNMMKIPSMMKTNLEDSPLPRMVIYQVMTARKAPMAKCQIQLMP